VIMRKLLFIAIVLITNLAAFSQKPSGKSKVMVMDIKAEIDPRMLRYVKLAIDHAEKTKADFVIVNMDTFGGGLAEAKDIVKLILSFKKPVLVYINTNAISAGAFISIACDSIYMSPGSSIGASSVVDGEGKFASVKVQSAMRAFMRSTAETNHRNPKIAESMVGVSSSDSTGINKVTTLTTTEAIANGYCEARVNSIEEILKRNKIENYELDHFELGASERIIAFFINPFISGLLILIIIGGLYFELQTPGAVFPIAASMLALIFYLVPYYLNGLAEYWEVIALMVGIILLIAEIFVIPGFGVAGVLGIGLTVGSLILIMLNNDFFNFEFVPLGDIVVATFSAIGGLTAGVLLLFFGGAKLTETKAFRRIALTDTQKTSHGYSVNVNAKELIGKTGIAHTVLRPSGKVLIDDQVYDAFTRGDYVQKGDPIEVIASEGITLKVKVVE